ncbi:MAG: hypothetical protein IJL47_06295 [Lachnospiraceae bacterium]|nr:hypothetical protein [Lachnospiraceae bacterium]
MAENKTRSDENRVLPEYTFPSEYTPLNPDISFFRESAVTAREENIFQGSVPPGEEENPYTAARRKKKKKKHFVFLQNLAGSALRAGIAAFGFLLVIGLIVLLNNKTADSDTARQAKEILNEAQRPLQVIHADYGPEEIGGVWSGNPAAPHRYDREHPLIVKEASCTEDGEIRYVCTECSVVLSEVLAARGHSPAEKVMENEEAGSCQEQGRAEEVVYCRVCHEELSREKITLAFGPHTPGAAVEENRTEATCTEDGSYDSVIYCDLCGEELSRKLIVLKATGHTEGEAVEENRTDASCTEDGSYDRVICCDVCGEELSRETIILEATGHTEGEAVLENETDASCTEGGSYDRVIYCDVCGEELSRETINTEALGHSYTASVTAPRCTAQGYTTHICSRCGDTYTDSYTAALGHSYTARVTAATCTARGYTTHTCSRCGSSYTDTYTAALGHNFGNAASSTCTRGCGTRAVTISYNASARGFNYSINNAFIAEAQRSGIYIAGMTVIDLADNSSFNSVEYDDGVTSGTIYPAAYAAVSGHQYELRLHCGTSTVIYSNRVTVP